jgi:hypothetical protein
MVVVRVVAAMVLLIVVVVRLAVVMVVVMGIFVHGRSPIGGHVRCRHISNY